MNWFTHKMPLETKSCFRNQVGCMSTKEYQSGLRFIFPGVRGGCGEKVCQEGTKSEAGCLWKAAQPFSPVPCLKKMNKGRIY